MMEVSFQIGGREVGKAEVRFPAPYELSCTVDGAIKPFYYSGDTDEHGRAIYTPEKSKADFV